MTLHVFLYSKSKRAESITLLNLGATENFMSLNYSKYLQLPIKTLKELRRLYNINRTPDHIGDLEY
jgi:hypothetical protein